MCVCVRARAHACVCVAHACACACVSGVFFVSVRVMRACVCVRAYMRAPEFTWGKCTHMSVFLYRVLTCIHVRLCVRDHIAFACIITL